MLFKMEIFVYIYIAKIPGDLAVRTQLRASLLISHPAGKQKAEQAAVNWPLEAQMMDSRHFCCRN